MVQDHGFYFKMKKYRQELIKSMNFLSKKRDTRFLGQSVSYSEMQFLILLKMFQLKKKLNFLFLKIHKWGCR